MSTRLGGRYQLVRELGAGAMGRVFQAVDTQTGQSVAAKIMLAVGEDNLDSLLRFYQEGAVLSTLKHPNIVEVYGTFLEEHTCWIIMEFLEGRALSQILRAEAHPLPLPRVKRIVQQVASALAYAHSRGIVHRDVKPDNIMVAEDDQVKVTDFGIARVSMAGSTLQTIEGLAVGTPLYMAPEQIEGQKVDGRADIYSLGAVLYQMVAGHPPFEGDDPLTVAFKHVHKVPQPPHELNRNLPPDWEALILTMLAKDPTHRYQTAAALEGAIAALQTRDDAAPQARSPGPAPAGGYPLDAMPPPDVAGRSDVSPVQPAPQVIPPEPIAGPVQVPPAVDTSPEPAPRAQAADPVATPLVGVEAVKTRPLPWPLPLWGWMVIGGVAVVVIALVVGLQVYQSGSPVRIVAPTAAPRSTGTSPAYQVLGTFGTRGAGPGQFADPHGIALDTQGNVYVADSGNGRIQKLKFSVTGAPLAQWGTPGAELAQFDAPSGVAVDRRGNIYVADTGNNRIQKLSPAGKLLAEWGVQGADPGQFSHPSGIAVDADGNVYVADAGNNRIQKFSPSGAVLGDWGTPGAGPGQFNAPMGVAVDAQGDVFVADTGNDRIQELASTSDPLAQWGTRGSRLGQFKRPTGVDVDAQGNVYVTDAGNNRIQKLSPAGKPLGAAGSRGAGAGQFQTPAAVAVGPQGVLYITDSGNDRVVKIAFSR